MLGDNNAVANLAVRNLDTAKKFYADTIGLKPIGSEGDEMIVFRSGNSTINVYRSQYAGTNKATAVTWTIDDVEGRRAHAQGQGREIRALRLARHDATGRRAHRRRDEGRLV